MTDAKRERIAKYLLQIFRNVWCDRESDSETYFNCSICEFEDGGWCRVKTFINTTKYEEECPQGAIAIEGGEDD